MIIQENDYCEPLWELLVLKKVQSCRNIAVLNYTTCISNMAKFSPALMKYNANSTRACNLCGELIGCFFIHPCVYEISCAICLLYQLTRNNAVLYVDFSRAAEANQERIVRLIFKVKPDYNLSICDEQRRNVFHYSVKNPDVLRELVYQHIKVEKTINQK